MILRKGIEADIQKLTDISKRAFNTDKLVGGAENDGPPDYDSEKWHSEMMEKGSLYAYVRDDNSIIGGAVLFGKDELFVGRIFIDPDFFRQGYGMALMRDIEVLFNSRTIKLDTPVWNERTNRFYKKCGYIETGRDDESVYYEKKLQGQFI